MEKVLRFTELFPEIYPEIRSVDPDREPNLIGVLIKSIFFHRADETLLCRGLVVHANNHQDVPVYTTANFRVKGISPVVGFDLDLVRDEEGGEEEQETWESVRRAWSEHFACAPKNVRVLHDDIKREVNAQVFPLKYISVGRRYMQTVRGALSFGDFCPNRGCYVDQDGNTPALCSGVMFGRLYFIPRHKLNETLTVSGLVYDHDRSEAEAKLFDDEHAPYFYKAACLDIETVFDKTYRNESLRCQSFAHKFPYCTEGTVAGMLEYRSKLVSALTAGRKQLPKHVKHVSIPSLAPDMSGQQHEITCISLVIQNSHIAKTSSGHHRKKLIVLYNKCKVLENPDLDPDHELAKRVGVDDVRRIFFFPCSGELGVLEKMIQVLRKYKIDLLYVYNAGFDIRVIEQRVHFYAQSSYVNSVTTGAVRNRCSALLRAWRGLFIPAENLSDDAQHVFQFETVRYLQMYKDMLKSVGSFLLSGNLTEEKLQMISMHVDKFNKDKAKLGHFKMSSCGLNIIDLYRMAGTRDVKFACISMKLNDVAPFLVDKVRELHGKTPKQARKLCKVSDVGYSEMDRMISRGGKTLFTVLLYNLVDSQLCARLAKVLKPVSALFHRCRTTLNIDVIVHGRGDNFEGFVQSIHSVQIPQLKLTLDSLRVKAGPMGKELDSRLRWDPRLHSSEESNNKWKGGSVCTPLTGLHYAGPGMGLELSFDFASMYPSIMCALNISPETTIPWPAVTFPHDLSGWVCYSWEAEGFQYASLILKYDKERGEFVRAPGVFASSVEYYLNKRAEFKSRLKEPGLTKAEQVYYKKQESECKVQSNAFYGTAPHPCGPLISGHGRHQIAVVNSCVATFYQHRCPVVYGDTDSVMVSVGYGPEDRVEKDLDAASTGNAPKEGELDAETLKSFAREARKAMGDKFERAGSQVSEFLDHVHTTLVQDIMERMYMIGRGNAHHRVVRDPRGTFTKHGYPVYLARVPGSDKMANVTEPFVENRRVKLEYENSCSIYCHVAKKTYVALTHNLDDKGELSSVSVKVRGLSAFKSVRSPCDSAVTDTFIDCVMRGDCVKLEQENLLCFSTCPWHKLKHGDVIFYLSREPTLDKLGKWRELDRANSFLVTYRVEEVTLLHLDSGFSAVSVKIVPLESRTSNDKPLTVRLLYKDEKYCMNHMFSMKDAIRRDLSMCKACQVIASKMGAGVFPWSSLIKSAKNKHFSQHTLDRLKVANSSVKTTYLEIVKTWLKKITGLSVKPIQCYEFHKCNPCEAAFYKYPLDLQAKTGCIKAMFGGSLACEATNHGKDMVPEKSNGLVNLARGQSEHQTGALISHPYQPLNKCFANSRVLIAHFADLTLVNSSGKLLAHCIIDYCLPRYMYSPALGDASLKDCKAHLVASIVSVRERLNSATGAFNAIMNNCPEHMLPVCGTLELEALRARRETVTRLKCERREACLRLITEDMSLEPSGVYKNLCAELGEKLRKVIAEGIAFIGDDNNLESSVSFTIPSVILTDSGIMESPITSYTKISVSRSELSERTLINLAGILYQTVLVLQVHRPKAFVSSQPMYPESCLCVMPYSCADSSVMQTWIQTFKAKKWLKARDVKLGKRPFPVQEPPREITYHCMGCKKFYKDLFTKKVPGQELIPWIYGPDKRRRLGVCVNE